MDRTLCAVGFFFNDTATTEIYTLSLHDALPIWVESAHATYQVRSSNQVLEPYRMHTYHRVGAKHVPEGIWDHTNALAMLLARKLKERHLHVRVIHEPNVCNASATLVLELVERLKLPFQLLWKPEIVVIVESEPVTLCVCNTRVPGNVWALIVLVDVRNPVAPHLVFGDVAWKQLRSTVD